MTSSRFAPGIDDRFPAAPLANTALHRYEAYGWRIASAFPLPELMSATGGDEADLTILAAPLDLPMPNTADGRLISLSECRSSFAWAGFGRVLVEDNRHMFVDLDPAFDPAMLGFILLGPVLAAILHHRGMSVLHASAVAVPDSQGGAMLLLGDSGTGKSTFAAACLSAGYELINDDLAAIQDMADEPPTVQPGYPSLKIARDALASFDPLPAALLRSVPEDAAKLRLRLSRIASRPQPIRQICVLRRGDTLGLQALSPSEGLRALMRYSYLPKLGVDALTGAAAARHFARCTMLADSVPTGVLTVPSSLDALADAPRRLIGMLA